MNPGIIPLCRRNHAQIIMSQGLCLEEYLEQYGS